MARPRARTGLAALAVILAVACGATGTALGATAADEVIVRFEAGLNGAERAAIRDQAGTVLERVLPVSGMQVLEVTPGRSAIAAELALEHQHGVLYAEPNVTRRAFVQPNDPYFPQLWGMENTGQSIFGDAGTPDADTDAADAWELEPAGGVIVAVVDTGVDGGHPDLAANMWRNPGESGSGRESNRVDDDRNGRIDDWRGWDFVANDSNPADENPVGHGTHVAGTIGARRDNGVGVAGVAGGSSRLMALRAFDAGGSGTVADAIAAYGYAAAAGARVVNLSFGSLWPSRAEQDAIAAFPGVLFVAAAGNSGESNDLMPEFPCAYPLPNVICVAASDNRDGLAAFSNYGARTVDLAAPGVDILSTQPGGGYQWLNGTSMATPHVSGAAALLWAAAPGASASAVASALLAGTDRAAAFSGRTVTGGRLNVLTSLLTLLNATRASAAPPQAEPPPPTPPARRTATDRAPPRISIRVRRHQRLDRVLRRGIALRLRCSEACSARVRLRVGGRVVAVKEPRSILAGAGRRIVVRVRRVARARLRADTPRRAILVVRATDRSGNSRTVTARILLRR